MTAAALSFITPVTVIVELLVADYMFALTFIRRQFFPLRFIGFSLVAAVITLWTETAYILITDTGYEYGGGVSNVTQSLFNLALYFFIFASTVVITALSYKESISRILLCCSGAYAMQHIARNVSSLIFLIPVFSVSDHAATLSFILGVAVCAAVYAGIYFLWIRRFRHSETYEGNNIRKVVLSLIVIVVCIGMSRITSDNPDRNFLSEIAESIYAVVSCSVLLISQFGVVENDSMHREVASMEELLRAERKQYELSRENIQLINEKCHDLKHQVAALRTGASEESISEIEHAVMIYDSMVKTGNDVLDVILSEKKLQCESKNVQMTCMARGDLVSFMDSADVYSLFGNALSNAIEGAGNVSDEQNRCVSVNVRDIGNLLSVHVENYFDGALNMENGLPVTDKDKNYHGFGMQSMNRIARKYGGEMTVLAENHKFKLDVLIPLPQKSTEN